MKTKYVVLTSKEDTNDYYIVFKSKGLFGRYYYFKSDFDYRALDSKIKQVAEGKPMDTIELRVFAKASGMNFKVMSARQFFAFML
jgi:hypothetical protein